MIAKGKIESLDLVRLLETLERPIANYKSSTHSGVFTEIAGYYYHENYHSDILAYFLSHSIAKRSFIEWLNEHITNQAEKLRFEEYCDGLVAREAGRIDITLFNRKKTAAVIIENKSNDAADQPKQIARYVEYLTTNNIKVEKVFYLNKATLKEPSFEGLSEEQKATIGKLVVVSQLVGHGSFCDNVIASVIANSDNIRLTALAIEIRELFFSVVYGGMNMENIKEFIAQLNDDGNHERLKKVMTAYWYIPGYLAKYYKDFLEKLETGHRFWIYKDECLVIDDIQRNEKHFAIDVWFSMETVDISILVRDGAQGDIDKLRDQMGDKFEFKTFENGRYRRYLAEPLHEASIKSALSRIVEDYSV